MKRRQHDQADQTESNRRRRYLSRACPPRMRNSSRFSCNRCSARLITGKQTTPDADPSGEATLPSLNESSSRSEHQMSLSWVTQVVDSGLRWDIVPDIYSLLIPPPRIIAVCVTRLVSEARRDSFVGDGPRGPLADSLTDSLTENGSPGICIRRTEYCLQCDERVFLPTSVRNDFLRVLCV